MQPPAEPGMLTSSCNPSLHHFLTLFPLFVFSLQNRDFSLAPERNTNFPFWMNTHSRLSCPEPQSFWGPDFTLHAKWRSLLHTWNKNNRIFDTLWLKSQAHSSTLAFRLTLWSTARHHSNPSFFKYGQHICRLKSRNALLEGHVTMDQTQGKEGQNRTNCTRLDTITWRPHEHTQTRE